VIDYVVVSRERLEEYLTHLHGLRLAWPAAASRHPRSWNRGSTRP
jgi:hypothetical protein